MIRKVLYATLATMALSVGAARAEDTIVWWDFLSGGDGVRMKAMLEEFNKEHAGKVKIDATTSNGARPSTPRCRPRRRPARVLTS